MLTFSIVMLCIYCNIDGLEWTVPYCTTYLEYQRTVTDPGSFSSKLFKVLAKIVHRQLDRLPIEWRKFVELLFISMKINNDLN
jgi:hypothetical protein